jgi:hypothetical protein
LSKWRSKRASKAANVISDAAGVDGVVYQYHTAVSLRLTEPWWNSGRAVIGDSWFASVRVTSSPTSRRTCTLLVISRRRATRGFCKNQLTDKCGTSDGSMLSMEAEVDIDGTKRKIHATALREGPRMLSGTCVLPLGRSSELIESTDEVEDEQGQREDVKSMAQEPTYIRGRQGAGLG